MPSISAQCNVCEGDTCRQFELDVDTRDGAEELKVQIWSLVGILPQEQQLTLREAEAEAGGRAPPDGPVAGWGCASPCLRLDVRRSNTPAPAPAPTPAPGPAPAAAAAPAPEAPSSEEAELAQLKDMADARAARWIESVGDELCTLGGLRAPTVPTLAGRSVVALYFS
jgi:hypothetical protein